MEIDHDRSKNRILSKFLPSFGILLILLSFIYFNHNIVHPSFYTLLPVIGVLLIIWFSNEHDVTTKLLSSKIFVGVGLISYSLYLYHYPIFAFSRITEFSTGSFNKQIFIALTILVLSILTYFIVEKPFRNRKLINIKFALSTLFVLQFSIIFFNFSTIKNNGFMKRFPAIITKNLGVYQEKESNFNNFECDNKINNFCIYNKGGKSGRIYLVGDSHLNILKDDLINELSKKDYEFVPIIRYGCWYLSKFNRVNLRTKKVKTGCDLEYQELVKKTLLSKDDSIIIIGGRLPLYLTSMYFNNEEGGVEWSEEKEWDSFLHVNNTYSIYEGIANSINDLLKFNQKVILIYPIPEVGWHVLKKIIIDTRFKSDLSSFMNNYQLTTNYDVYKKRTKESFTLLDSVSHKNLYRIYPHKLFCNIKKNNRCITHNKDEIFYKDDDHLSKKGSELLNNLILKKIDVVK